MYFLRLQLTPDCQQNQERSQIMKTREHTSMKMRGNPDISYLGHTVDQMIWSFMEKEKIDGLTLAIVQAPYKPMVAG